MRGILAPSAPGSGNFTACGGRVWRLRAGSGEFRRISALSAALRAQPAASYFLPGQKVTKEPPGVGAIGRNSCAVPASMPPAPWTPILRGPPIRVLLWFSQRRGWGGDWLYLPHRCRCLCGFPCAAVPSFEGAPLCAVGHKFCGGAGWVVTSTTLERWLHRRRRGRGTPPFSTVHRTRAQWPGGSWDCPLKTPRAGTFPSMNRRIPP